MVYTLEHDAVEKTLEEWGLEDGVLTKLNRGAGTLTFTMAAELADNPPWAFRDPVTLRLNGAVVWRGVTVPTERRASGDEVSMRVTFNDLWWWLGQGTYTQEVWDATTAAAVQSGKVALFRAINAGTGWARLTIAAQLAALIAYVNEMHGGNLMQLGTVNGPAFDLIPTGNDIENMTPEQALNATLQLVPDAVQRWDYTTTPPTLHLYQRSVAPAHELTIGEGVVVESSIKSREDLAARGVRIIYHYVNNGVPVTVVDEAGETTGVNVLVSTLDLSGGGAGSGTMGGGNDASPVMVPPVREEYEIVSEALPYMDAEWWFKNAETGAESAADIEVGFGTTMILDTSAPENAGFADLGGCTLQLRTPLAGWQSKSHARRAVVLGYLKVTSTWDYEDGFSVDFVSYVKAWVKLAVTDLPSDIYDHALQDEGSAGGGSSNGPGEPGLGGSPVFIPEDIAEQLMASLGQVHHEGRLRLEDDECRWNMEPGDVVNLDDHPDHEDMRAQVQEVTLVLATGETHLTLGPPEHMAVQEFMQLVKIMRMSPPVDLDARATGESSGGGGGSGGGFASYTLKPPAGNVSVQVSTRSDIFDVEITGGEVDVKTKRKSSTGESSAEDGDGNKRKSTTTFYELTNDDGDRVWMDINGFHIAHHDGREAHYRLGDIRLANADETKVMNVTTEHLTVTDGDKEGSVRPEKVEVIDGAGKRATVSFADGIQHEADGNFATASAEDGIKHQLDGAFATMDANDGVNMTIGGNTAALSPDRLSIDQGGGSTVILTPEGGLDAQSGSERVQATPAGGFKHTNASGDEGILRSSQMKVSTDDDFAQATPGGGFENSESGNTGSVGANLGMQLEKSGGTVNLQCVPSKNVELISTDICDETLGTLASFVLRSELE